MIIYEQTIRRQKKKYDDDLKKIQIYEKNINIKDLYDKFRYIKTDRGILDYKYKLLKHVYNNNNNYIGITVSSFKR